jgi:error-prone DNA polymerase
VRDAREHGVEVRPVDVNRSVWDCTLEAGLALRLGLRMVSGLARDAAEALLAAREARNGAPFAGVEDAALRAGLDRRALGALADAGGFREAGRRKAIWDAAAMAPELPLFAVARGTAEAAMAAHAPLQPEPEVALPAQGEAEAVVEDYRALGLTLGRHPMALLRPTLDGLRLHDSRALATLPRGSWVRLPGLVLMRQRPGSAKGVVFLTVEDEWGVGNLVVYPDVAARDRAALVAGRLLLAEGRVEREAQHAEVPIIHLIVRRLRDRTPWLDALSREDAAWADHALGRADEVRKPDMPRAPAHLAPHLARSRDFR